MCCLLYFPPSAPPRPPGPLIYFPSSRSSPRTCPWHRTIVLSPQPHAEARRHTDRERIDRHANLVQFRNHSTYIPLSPDPFVDPDFSSRSEQIGNNYFVWSRHALLLPQLNHHHYYHLLYTITHCRSSGMSHAKQTRGGGARPPPMFLRALVRAVTDGTCNKAIAYHDGK